jgi:hypothetical protein
LWIVALPALAAPVSGPRAITTEATSVSSEFVVNGSAVSGVAGWTAHSAAGPLTTRRIAMPGPVPGTSALQVSRTGGTGDWAFAMAALRSPGTVFQVGRTYRMQAWVRDPAASGASVGLLLANGSFAHRPTPASVYDSFHDRGWHRLSRTFVCTEPGFADTGLYVQLPGTGPFAVQITGASVRAVGVPLPPVVSGAPAHTIRFAGPRGAPPDPATWRYETGGNGWGNGELQTYLASVANARLDGAGRLEITARQQRTEGSDGIARPFTSARLTTQDKVVVPAGSYVEASLTAPTGDGVWPAFWLAGANISEVGWPAAGELDVFEGWGANPTVAHSAIHLGTRADPHAHREYGWDEPGGTTDLHQPLDARAHRYGVYFDSSVVRFYIDRRPTMTVWADDAVAAGYAWPFDRPQHMILNVAVPAGKHSAFPKVMTVDYISVWSDGVPFA